MKAIILAAGEGRRMLPLTLEKPKPMLSVLGKPLLEYIFECLPDEINEILLVVGYKREIIESYFGTHFRGKKIKYIVQTGVAGTADALKLCQPFLLSGERFLLMYADDIYDKESIKHCLRRPMSLLVAEVKDPRRYGVVELWPDGTVAAIEEKPEKPKTNLITPGVYVLDTDIFNYEPTRNQNGEYYLTTMLDGLLRDRKVYAEKTVSWITIASPDDLRVAEEKIKKIGTTH